jgi:hypothetical protein
MRAESCCGLQVSDNLRAALLVTAGGVQSKVHVYRQQSAQAFLHDAACLQGVSVTYGLAQAALSIEHDVDVGGDLHAQVGWAGSLFSNHGLTGGGSVSNHTTTQTHTPQTL